MNPVVILAAGKSSRLGGVNKLMVNAGGLPVHEWHRRAFDGTDISIVVAKSSISAIKTVAPWATKVVGTTAFDGPVGALDAYLSAANPTTRLTVVFADTLIPPQPMPSGDWVGVAGAPSRRWDMPSRGHWIRGVPRVPVCVGIYSFADIDVLREAIPLAKSDAAKVGETDIPMTMLLNRYAQDIPWFKVRGWHDAGDPAAIASVPDWKTVVADKSDILSVEGSLDVRWTR